MTILPKRFLATRMNGIFNKGFGYDSYMGCRHKSACGQQQFGERNLNLAYIFFCAWHYFYIFSFRKGSIYSIINSEIRGKGGQSGAQKAE